MTVTRVFWIGVVTAVIGYSLIMFWAAPQFADADGLPFDLRKTGYTLAETQSYLASLNAEETAAYLGPERIADTIYPLGLLLTFGLGVYLAVRRWSPVAGLVLALVALAYFGFDMAENAAVAGLLKAGAEGVTQDQVAQASVLSVWKWRLAYPALGLFVLGWAARLIDWFASRNKESVTA